VGEEALDHEPARIDLSVLATSPDVGVADHGNAKALASQRNGQARQIAPVDGAGARHLDQASIDEYGLYRPPALQTVAADPGAALSVAAWRVDAYGQPRIRTPSVTVRLHRLEEIAPSLIPALLALTIGSKVRLAELPTQAPASTVDVMVEGWQEEITLVSWTITFNTSPADIWDVWQLNVAGHDELGTTTVLAQGGPI